MSTKKTGIILILIAFIAVFFILDLGQYLSFDYLKAQRETFQAYAAENPFQTALYFFLVYVLVTGLSLPGAAVMTLLAGALFGLLQGTILVSFASTLGATIACLVSRLLLRDWVQSKFGDSLKAINTGVEKEGAFYLFGLRLVPLFPFFVINLVMGLTPIKLRTFFWVSQLGMLPGTVVFVNAGTQLGQLESTAGVLSPDLIISFVLLGVFPIIAKKIMNVIKAKKVYAKFQRPDAFDRNMVVIGAGSAGLVTSYIAAAVKANVSLIEKHKMGGDCLNTGCVPSKALIRSAKMSHYCDRADEFGLILENKGINFAKVMERVQSVVHKVEPHDSVERYNSLGVDCIEGEATILDPFRVQVGDRVLTTRNIVIATGARPLVPPIPGVNETNYYTSDTIWDLREKPESLLILGGGPIGCELSQAFNRLGVNVKQMDMAPRLMPREDADVAAVVEAKFKSEGIELLLGHKAQEFKTTEDGHKVLISEHEGSSVETRFDALLLAVGRKANTDKLGLENIGLQTNPNGTLKVNEYMETYIPNIYAAGDIAGPYQFTHTAAHQAWYAAVNGLFGSFKKFKVDYRVIPWATFTDPEVARVGLSEEEAKAQNIACEITKFGIDDLDRAIADGEDHGFIKVLTVPGKDKILGATIVGYHAAELITEYISAMKHGLGLNKILGTIHIYPTLSETNKYAAGEWKRAHAPEKLLGYLQKFHQWRIGASKQAVSIAQSDNA